MISATATANGLALSKTLRLVVMTLGLCLMSACATRDPATAYKGYDAEALYSQAVALIPQEEGLVPLDLFEREYPDSPLFERVMVLKLYLLYCNAKFDNAIDEADRFIKLYPASDNVDYVSYIRALSYYDRVSDVGRDEEMTIKSLEALDDFLRGAYHDPQRSKYLSDVLVKRRNAFNMLASKEMGIGRFYLRRHNFIAALNRFHLVISVYKNTVVYPEAIYRMVEICCALGLQEEAKLYNSLFQSLDQSEERVSFWARAAQAMLANE